MWRVSERPTYTEKVGEMEITKDRKMTRYREMHRRRSGNALSSSSITVHMFVSVVFHIYLIAKHLQNMCLMRPTWNAHNYVPLRIYIGATVEYLDEVEGSLVILGLRVGLEVYKLIAFFDGPAIHEHWQRQLGLHWLATRRALRKSCSEHRELHIRVFFLTGALHEQGRHDDIANGIADMEGVRFTQVALALH